MRHKKLCTYAEAGGTEDEEDDDDEEFLRLRHGHEAPIVFVEGGDG